MNRVKDKRKSKKKDGKPKRSKTKKQPRTTAPSITTRRRFGFVPILHLTDAPVTTARSSNDESVSRPLHHVVALVAEKVARTLNVSTNVQPEEAGSGHGEEEIVVTM